MAKWVGEVSVRQVGKSYYRPATFVVVEAGSYAAALGAAVREAKRRLDETAKGLRVESVLAKLTREKETTVAHE